MHDHPIVHEGSIRIAAPRKKVWSVITCGEKSEKTLCAWVGGADAGGLFFQGDWRRGGEVKMLDGKDNGAVVRIIDCEPGVHLKYEQVATLEKGRRDDSENEWTGISDEFRLQDDPAEDAGTLLYLVARYPEFCRATLPAEFQKSMQKIRQLAEDS